jgi:hypothetical protein
MMPKMMRRMMMLRFALKEMMNAKPRLPRMKMTKTPMKTTMRTTMMR